MEYLGGCSLHFEDMGRAIREWVYSGDKIGIILLLVYKSCVTLNYMTVVPKQILTHVDYLMTFRGREKPCIFFEIRFQEITIGRSN